MVDVTETGRILVKRVPFLALVAGIAAACSSDPASTPADAGIQDASQLDGGEAEESACEDDDGFIPSCEPVTGLAERQCDRATCDRYVRRMKTKIARRAIDCMKRHIATGDSCRPCSAEALQTSCVDTIAMKACEALAKSCPARDVASCVPFVAGLSFGGRLTFITCTTESTCLHDMPSCLP